MQIHSISLRLSVFVGPPRRRPRARPGWAPAARQTVHITYGLLLDQPWFRDAFFATMAAHEEAYYAALVRHLGKHVRILTAGTDV